MADYPEQQLRGLWVSANAIPHQFATTFTGSALVGEHTHIIETSDETQPTLENVCNRQIERAHDLIKAARWRVALMENILRGDITLEIIQEEDNLELQRLMFAKYGLEKYLADAGATRIKKDEYGELLETLSPIRSRWGNNNRVRIVKVKNSTAELDGTFKYYLLRVPPDTRTPRGGIAWTFGLQEHEYNPELMT